ncbi:MAG: FAD-dependent oxidoreductase [Minisyncoccia bacterium]|jgi:NAD(P)H-nitrite reductase large subunit
MQKYKYVIVGGGIAGTTAAETIRGRDPDGSIVIITDELYPLYSRVMLSKPSFLLEKEPQTTIWLKTPDWYETNRIMLVKGQSVTALDASAKTLVVGTETFGYEKLLLALGARARKWTVVGADKKGVYYLRTLDEAKEIAAAMKTTARAVIIGSSCVAFEAMENLVSAGIKVTVVMLEKYFWEPMLDEESGRVVEKALTDAGVEIFRQSEVKEVLGGESVEGIVIKNDEKVDCDMVLCGIGVVFLVEWVKAAGVEIGRGIKANEYLETNTPDIWAAGDVAEYNDAVLNERCMAGNWMSAREQGKVSGLNMTGAHESFKLVSFYTSHGFGLNVAFGGDIRLSSDKTTVSRGSLESGSRTRLIIHGDKIVGVSVVNRIFELATIIKLIQDRTDISSKRKELSDSEFDLKQLVSNP